MAGMLQMRRSRGAFSGFLLVLGRVASVTSGIRAVEPEAVPAETVPISTVPASTVPASTVPAGTVPAGTVPPRGVPASTASDLPLRTRADAVPAKHARNETTGDTTQTIG